MKTSNKLLIAAILLGVSVTLVVFQMTIHKLGRDLVPKYEDRFSPLADFSVVVALENTQFDVEGSQTNQLKWRVAPKEADKKHGAELYVRNDTLYVKHTPKRQRFDVRLVVCCKNLKSVVAENHATIELRRLQAGMMHIVSSNSKVVVNNWSDEAKKPSTSLLDLNVEACDSAKVDLYNVKIGRLNARLDRHATLWANERVEIATAESKLSTNAYQSFDRMPLEMHAVADTSVGCAVRE